MNGWSCPDFAEARSAYVDGHLSEDERQLLLRHLSDCSDCRSDLVELRRLRSLLTETGSGTAVPSDLSDRLTSIGDRPPARVAVGPPRSARPGRTVTMSAAGAALLLALIAGVGYVAAPADAAAGRQLEDPTESVPAEFAAALAQAPMSNSAVAAALLADPAQLAAPDVELPEAPAMAGPDLTDDRVQELLTGAQWASSRVEHSGLARVVAPRDGRTTAAEVEIDFVPGRGSEVAVRDLSGRPLTEGLLPTAAASQIAGPDLMSALSANYEVSGTGGGSLLGRPVSLIEVHRPDDGRTLAARWWIDDATGLVLRQQTYDHARRLVVSAGYTRLQIGDRRDVGRPSEVAPLLGSPLTAAAFTTSSADRLASQGWFCHDELAGMSLVRLRGDTPAEPGVLHMIYTDGMSTVSVLQRRGGLDDPPAESEWDPGLSAYRDDAILNTATWQSGGTVFTVATDGSTALRNRVVAALPHEAPAERTTMERIQAGWSRILDIAVG